MRESMQHMHTKLTNIDGEVLLTVQEQTVPLAGQVVGLQQQVAAQFEQIGVLTTAMTQPYPTSVSCGAPAPGSCGACGADSPWAADAAGHCSGTSSSGDAHAATMSRLVGGNGLCHCIHVTELLKDVAAS